MSLERPLKIAGVAAALFVLDCAYEKLTVPSPAGILEKMTSHEKFDLLNQEGRIAGIKSFLDVSLEERVALLPLAAQIAGATEPHVVVKGDSYEGLVRERLRAAHLAGEKHPVLSGRVTENRAFDLYVSLIYRLKGIYADRPLKVGETIELPTEGAARLFAISAQYPYSLAGGATVSLNACQTDVKGRLSPPYVPARKR